MFRQFLNLVLEILGNDAPADQLHALASSLYRTLSSDVSSAQKQ
jgi:hypothetical protein